ncbi:hypothetical protein [Chitinophaga arvensicola]|uniref:Uncharacterized protein n=1 Tax=Chitinophaga arvensicola TaxID=29529 RepID=A0A1I0SE10_9BACT|nr:hypothetical protein [Chitinophaga arvensicola]SEW57444.1 hypothetical protein SAMN04488122_6787 [Chitinophaga arvensicola]
MTSITDLLQKLNKFKQDLHEFSNDNYTILPDSKGMIDRQCPHCTTLFKINSEDYETKMQQDDIFCPNCKVSGTADDFFPEELKEKIKKVIQAAIIDNWNQETPMNDISIQSNAALEMVYVCTNCNIRYATTVSPNACPSCGTTN